MALDLSQLQQAFEKYPNHNEDDIKLHFYSEIVKPLLEMLNPSALTSFKSENRLISGGRTDATFQNISFEYKKYSYFNTHNGIKEAIIGRGGTDHGLYDYIISNSGITSDDSDASCINKLIHGIGVGFDGKQFIFARFVPSNTPETIYIDNLDIEMHDSLNVHFT